MDGWVAEQWRGGGGEGRLMMKNGLLKILQAFVEHLNFSNPNIYEGYKFVSFSAISFSLLNLWALILAVQL